MNNYKVDIRTYKSYPQFKENFLSKIPKECFLKENKDACWHWQGVKTPNGYGRISWGGDCNYAAHRISYIIFKGLIPYDLIIRHICNNKRCVNPKHLITGTYQDNSQDMVMANRQGHQKLNEECVKVIKWMLKYRPEHGLAKRLSELHAVGTSTITQIKNGSQWGWVKV